MIGLLCRIYLYLYKKIGLHVDNISFNWQLANTTCRTTKYEHPITFINLS